MHYSEEFFSNPILTNSDNINCQSCITFSLEGQSFGLLIPEDAKFVFEKTVGYDQAVDVRKILDMPVSKVPAQNIIVSRNNQTYKIEVDVAGYEIPFDNLIKEGSGSFYNSLWEHIAEGTSYINDQIVVLLSFEKMITCQALMDAA